MPSLRLQRLQLRIVSVYLGLAVVVQAAAYMLIHSGIDRNASAAIHAELVSGQRIFARLLEQNAVNLSHASRDLVNDDAFRAALVADDRDRLVSGLARQAERVGGAETLLLGAQGQLLAGTHADAARYAPALQAWLTTQERVSSTITRIAATDHQAIQWVATPVRLPALAGWVVIGSRIDDELLKDMRQLSDLDVAQISADGAPGARHWQVTHSTLAPGRWADLSGQWAQVGERPASGPQAANELTQAQATLTLGGSDFRLLPAPLSADSVAGDTQVLLLRSVDDALAPYRQLKWTLMILTAFGVLVFGVGSVITARRITRPLTALSGSIQRLGAGDFDTAVPVRGTGELGELAQAFENMRQAIQHREGEIRRLAYRDKLTDLPNREQFRDDLRQTMARGLQSGQPCAILMLDLDRFKHVNDVLGHRFGDRLLRQVAKRLRDEALSPQDVLARLGGDEFAVLLPLADAPSALVVAQRMLRTFERPITLDDHKVDLGAGIGIASCPAHAKDADQLISRAEVAMYAAKHQQAGTVTYHPGLDSCSEESLTMLGELRQAVDFGQLQLYMQPKVSLRTGRVVGAEALLRWQHPERGAVPPMRFIPFAEQTGFVRVLTSWMIERTAITWRALRAQGLQMKLSVNLSTRDLMDQDLPDKIARLLGTHGVEAGGLILEITESAIMDDPQRALATLERLHEMGLKLSIDDFGTGYSSLAYLKRLPVDELKIDKSFVMNMESDIHDAKIVRSTVDLAHNLGLSVVAEGMESTKSWKLLAGLRCDEAQGFLIAKPMPAEQFAAWARVWVPPHIANERLGTEFAAML
jgi:diguanylate cyclase (GGDEF)-like protein